MEIATIERLEKSRIDLQWVIFCDHSSAFNFELTFFMLADKKDNYKSLNGFEFLQDPITYCGVSCPLASQKLIDTGVTTLVPSFLIGSSSFFQATRSTIKA